MAGFAITPRPFIGGNQRLNFAAQLHRPRRLGREMPRAEPARAPAPRNKARRLVASAQAPLPAPLLNSRIEPDSRQTPVAHDSVGRNLSASAVSSIAQAPEVAQLDDSRLWRGSSAASVLSASSSASRSAPRSCANAGALRSSETLLGLAAALQVGSARARNPPGCAASTAPRRRRNARGSATAPGCESISRR